MSSVPHERKRGPWIASLVVLLALIGGFFLGSRFSFFPKDPPISAHNEWETEGIIEPQLTVWVSKDKFFVWRDEAPRRLEELPARIKEYTAKHQPGAVSISAEELVRFEDAVYVLGEFRKSGFAHVDLYTRPEPMPPPKGK